VKDLKSNKPIQYILKHVDFLNTRIIVNETVLIPRPETEELVQHIINEEKGNKELRVLDIGTGSGCIAIALAKNLHNAEVVAIDSSETALKTASKNIFVNEVMVHFEQFDILEPHIGEDLGQFDVIVSNPPYVMEADKNQMRENVLKYEPHDALFVTGNDPLSYYRAILYFAGEHLIEKGRLYLEINEKYGNEVADLLKKNEYRAKLYQDVFEKNRFVSGVKDLY
jgi:release factor glutamine methyltransferase